MELTKQLATALIGNDFTVARDVVQRSVRNNQPDYIELWRDARMRRLNALATTQGHQVIVKATAMLLQQMMNRVQVKYKATANDIVDIADELVRTSDEDSLTLEDIAVFCHVVLRGRFGKVYDRFDYPMMMEWLEAYRDERWRAMVEYNEAIHAQRKTQSMFPNAKQEQPPELRKLDSLSGVVGDLKRLVKNELRKHEKK